MVADSGTGWKPALRHSAKVLPMRFVNRQTDFQSVLQSHEIVPVNVIVSQVLTNVLSQ